MTLIDKTAAEQTETLTFELESHHAPEKVWRALTEPTLLAEWLLPVVGFELSPGTEFAFETQPQPGWDGKVQCRLLESDAPRTLRYTWVVGDMDTVVTFTLRATGSGTHLSIVHTGFKPTQKQNFGGARYGWKMMAGNLVELLARGL